MRAEGEKRQKVSPGENFWLYGIYYATHKTQLSKMLIIYNHFLFKEGSHSSIAAPRAFRKGGSKGWDREASSSTHLKERSP